MTARIAKDSSRIICIVFLSALVALSISCGGGGGSVLPDTLKSGNQTDLTPNTRNALAPQSYGNHQAWGVFTMILDRENKSVEVVENRELAFHLNVKNILKNKMWCPANNCIKIQFINIDEPNGLYTIKGTLLNPTYFTGYDVRAIIFYDDKGHDLLNADDYTMLYEIGTDINPFRSFAKTVEIRAFKPYSIHSEIFEMYIPPVPKKFWIDFAIDASYPTNCIEPYDLENFGFEGKIYPDDPDLAGTDQGEGTIFSEVYDWQDNIQDVSVDTTPITGHITHLSYNPDTERYEASITNSQDAVPGDYRCLLAAFSTDDPTIGLYNYLVIHVDETPPPAVQTIWGSVGDAFTLFGIDGAMVSVVNQDPLGFQPPPTTVVDGSYLVNVVTGTYDISVVSNDPVHYPSICWNVPVTTNEDVHIDFGLQDPYVDDPTGYYFDIQWYQVTGFAGRVVDPLGMPISSATVELSSPDYINYYYTVQGEDFLIAGTTDEQGYYSILNIPLQAYSGDYTITTINMSVQADGYSQVFLGPFTPVPNEMPYNVTALDPLTESPIWQESFEEDTGWSINGYYHRQLYDPSIVNVSFLPQYRFVYEPYDENWGGGLPYPTDGTYMLWYGIEADGNFLGSWDPSQSPWSGGLSDFDHAGTATSPPIDLNGYTSARLEFDMSYDIESVQPAEFEEMRVWVNGNIIKFMNGFMEPGPPHFTITQKGYNRTMIWCHYVFDISAYVDTAATIAFTFSTDDNLYNGCRGQVIDNIKVYAE
ncbi:MAG: carboxypeptidase-like regulatory domain-containing protein [bacterium]